MLKGLKKSRPNSR